MDNTDDNLDSNLPCWYKPGHSSKVCGECLECGWTEPSGSHNHSLAESSKRLHLNTGSGGRRRVTSPGGGEGGTSSRKTISGKEMGK